MLFLANVLALNGGTTFVLRLSREFHKRGKKVGVFVLVDIIDKHLEFQIKKYAEIFYLKDYVHSIFKVTCKTPLGCFVPVNFDSFDAIVNRYGRNIHVMGVFGLLFVKRYIDKNYKIKNLTFGIYHQNEIMFERVPYYFAKAALILFGTLPSKSIVFFNENTIRSFEVFFKNNYEASTLTPIGIDLPEGGCILGSSTSSRVVSIGNLHVFKAYNKHVISSFPQLLLIKPNLVYEIYGAGPYESELRGLVRSLKLESSIIFKGTIAYEDIPSVLAGALVFVGSGTAIIEASALGVPSIVGIESAADPVTFGYLCEIPGFSYNEMQDDRELFGIYEKFLEVIDNTLMWEERALACKIKAQTFSVEHTANDFLTLEYEVENLDKFRLVKYKNMHSAISFVSCAIKLKLGLSDNFSNRRNQGTIA